MLNWLMFCSFALVVICFHLMINSRRKHFEEYRSSLIASPPMRLALGKRGMGLVSLHVFVDEHDAGEWENLLVVKGEMAPFKWRYFAVLPFEGITMRLTLSGRGVKDYSFATGKVVVTGLASLTDRAIPESLVDAKINFVRSGNAQRASPLGVREILEVIAIAGAFVLVMAYGH